MNNMTYPTLDPIATGRKIRELRRENHIKVDDIVSFMGFESQQAVYKWQRGESLPSVDNLYALSRLFGTTVDDILVGCEEEDPSSVFILGHISREMDIQPEPLVHCIHWFYNLISNMIKY